MMVAEPFNKLHVKKYRGEIGKKDFSCDLKIKQRIFQVTLLTTT